MLNRSPSPALRAPNELPSRRATADAALHGLWIALLLASLVTVLIPFQDSGGGLKTAQWLGSYAAGVAVRLYGVIKLALPWLVVGALLACAWPVPLIRRWALGIAAVGALAGGMLLPSAGWPALRDLLSVLPGLATGLWIGQQALSTQARDRPSGDGRLGAATAARLQPPATAAALPLPRPGAPRSKGAVWAGRAAGLALGAVTVAGLIDLPGWPLALAAGLGIYTLVLCRWPLAALLVIPAALPLLDLAPWTGRFFWDEFDLLMLTTLSVGLALGHFRAAAWRSSALRLLVPMLLLSAIASLLLGLLPLQPWDANALSAYWSHYNSLRLAKGLLWGLVFFGLFRSWPDRERAFDTLASGMALAVLGVAAWALWEQQLFAGTANTADYRVTGSFSSMHTGGGHFEAWLVIALPFVWGLAFRWRHPALRAVLGAVFLLGAYALFSTVARGGAIALGVALLVLVVGSWRARRAPAGRRGWVAAPLVLGGVTLAVMVAAASGGFWQQRIAQTWADADLRGRHWSELLALRDASWMTALAGQGLGSLPAVNLANQLPDQAGSYRYAREPGNTYLRLNSAGTLYMAQRVALPAPQPLTLQLAARAPAGKAGLEASLCEKSLFNSRQCRWLKLDVKPGGRDWQSFSQTFDGGDLGAGSAWLRPPVQFSLYNPVAGSLIDVDAVQLLDAQGRDLLANGDFEAGGDRWFFKSGDHLFWHAKNLWVHLLFEQGWLGVSLFGLAAAAALARLARAALRGALPATVWLAALAATLTVGVVDSLLDAPRLAQLVYLMLLVGASWRNPLPSSRAATPAAAPFNSQA